MLPARPARHRLLSGSCPSVSRVRSTLPSLPGRPHAVALRFVCCGQLTGGLPPSKIAPMLGAQQHGAEAPVSLFRLWPKKVLSEDVADASRRTPADQHRRSKNHQRHRHQSHTLHSTCWTSCSTKPSAWCASTANARSRFRTDWHPCCRWSRGNFRRHWLRGSTGQSGHPCGVTMNLPLIP